MKVLLLADVCNPNWPSLPSFSYSLAKSISENLDVVLVTHIRNKQDISKLNTNFDEVVYIDNEYIASPLYKFSGFLRRVGIGGWMTNMALKYPSNIAFEYEVYKLFKSRFKKKEFDLIHRISPVSPTIASPIVKWSDTPFILGPLNGALAWPQEFREEIKKEREILVHVRNLYKCLPYYKSSFTQARKILAAFSHVEKDIPESEHSKIIRFNELGVDTELYKPIDDKVFDSSISCEFLFVGRLVPYKCPHVVITAFARSPILREKHKLTIVGDGPERKTLQKLIDDNNLADSVKILGWKEQPEVAEYMRNSDVFVFPTIREVGGNVLIEAMSAGLPSIVPDYGGPSELVNDKVGIKVSLSNREEFQQAFIREMERLAGDVELRRQLSVNARNTALEFHSWDVKGTIMKKIYESALKA